MIAQFFFLLQIVAPVFIVMALGYAMRKIDILSSEADRSLTRLVVTLLAPCLAFDTIIGNEGLANPKNWILPPILGFASIALGILVSRFGVKCFRIPEGNAARTFIFTACLHNYSYIPLPLCHALGVTLTEQRRSRLPARRSSMRSSSSGRAAAAHSAGQPTPRTGSVGGPTARSCWRRSRSPMAAVFPGLRWTAPDRLATAPGTNAETSVAAGVAFSGH